MYLLVDHAGAPGLVRELQSRPEIPWTSLFEGSTEQGAIDVAPILLHLPAAGSRASERVLLSWLQRACQFSTSFTALWSTFQRDTLSLALKRRLDAMLPEHMPVMLRYFDTRTLEALLRVLTDRQRAQFLGVASRWLWLDRAGCLQAEESQQQQTDQWPSPFEMDEAQQNALIEASEPDALVQQMQTLAPDLCQDQTRADLHALASQCMAKLSALGLSDLRTQTLYCLTALHLGPAFDSQPEWAEVLGRVGTKQLSFESALKEMGV